MAVNCCVWSAESEIDEFVGLMVRAVTVLLLTVRVTSEVTLLLDLAVMVVLPSATPVANPEVSIVAIPVCEEVQVTDEVTSPVLLSPKVAVALYCWVACGKMNAPVGEMARETIVFLSGKNPEQLPSMNARNTTVPTLPKRASPPLRFIQHDQKKYLEIPVPAILPCAVESSDAARKSRLAEQPKVAMLFDRSTGWAGQSTRCHASRVTDTSDQQRDHRVVGNRIAVPLRTQPRASWLPRL